MQMSYINDFVLQIGDMFHQMNFLKKVHLLDPVLAESEMTRIKRRYFTLLMDTPFTPGTGYVYALLLENEKFYVGWTENLSRRLLEHFSGEGAKWTQLHKPVRVIEITEGDKDYETKRAKEYIELKGEENVRGGPWTRTEIKKKSEIKRKYDDYIGASQP